MTSTSDDQTTATVVKQQLDHVPVESETHSDDTTDQTKSKGGAPAGNRNALKTGLRSPRLPAGCEYIHKQAISFRRAAEAATVEVRGRIGVFETAVLQTASEWQIYALKLRRMLLEHDDTLTVDQKVAYGEKAAKSFAQRDAALKMLGLDKLPEDQRATLYGLPLGLLSDSDDSEASDEKETHHEPSS